jgi:Bacterial Ig domain
MMCRKTPAVRLVATTALLVVAVAAIQVASAAGSPGCAPAAPTVSVDNNYAWGAPGSYGLAGQQLKYAVKVANNDVGCGSSSFAVTLSVPTGFTVSTPSSTISLSSTSSGYLFAYVTSPVGVADGDYALNASVQRGGVIATSTSYYKVYSSDGVAPTLFYPNPWDGATLSSKSYTVTVSSSDDHAVRTIDLYIDGAYTTTTACDDVSYQCQLVYKWSLKGVRGQHAITFKSYDWWGNVTPLTVNFTVGGR